MSAPDQKAPEIVYAFGEDGQITRTDKDSTIQVATLKDGNVLVLVPEWQKFRPAVVRWLNAQDKTPSAIYLDGDEPDPKAKKKDIPPAPKKDPRFGDKTPAFVEWMKRYKPEEYRALYGIKGTGTVTKYREEFDPKQGGRIRVPYEVEATIALRKTHLTEKVEANEGEVDEGGEPEASE
jgi:hypothetical protein